MLVAHCQHYVTKDSLVLADFRGRSVLQQTRVYQRMHGTISRPSSSDRIALAVARTEWSTVALIAACHAAWLLAGILYSAWPLLSVPLLALTIVLHSSLQHEAIHRHPTRHAGWNEALVWLPLGLLVPYRRFREQHLLHHVDERLTDPYDDPESFYLARRDWERMPRVVRWLLARNNTLAVRLVVGPVVTAATYLWAEAKGLVRPADHASGRRIRTAWALHGAGLVVVGLIVHFVFAMPLGSYLLATYLARSLLAMRSFCEHQWAEQPQGRTVIVERSVLGLLFLNNNLHVVHHAQPGLPWHALPSAYRARREAWQALNGGYVFRGYGAVLRRFAWRAKEPVPHPVR
jgi:fatty acid desaturase